jgi:hypothetical protein
MLEYKLIQKLIIAFEPVDFIHPAGKTISNGSKQIPCCGRVKTWSQLPSE